MNIFKESEFRFTAKCGDYRVVSCQALNGIFLTDKDGNGLGGPALVYDNTFTDIKKPQGIVVARDEIYVVDRDNGCVHVFGKSGEKLKHVRTFGKGLLNQPVGIAFEMNGLNDKIYIADNENHRIAVFDMEGELIESIGEGYGQKPNQFFCPCGVALFKGFLLVAEWGNGRLQVFKDGKYLFMLQDIPHAHDVIVNPNGDVFIAQYSDKRIRKFRIDATDEGHPCFFIGNDFIQLEHNPTSLFWDDGKLGVVSKTHLFYVQ